MDARLIPGASSWRSLWPLAGFGRNIFVAMTIRPGFLRGANRICALMAAAVTLRLAEQAII
jgi:hypothetical protein